MEALTHCEYEIQEVMKQIDILVVSKQREWESKHAAVLARLAERDHELQRQYEICGSLKGEIAKLESKLELAESEKEQLSVKHVGEIAELRKAFASVKDEYMREPKDYMAKLRTSHSKEMREVKSELKSTLKKLQSACRDNSQLKQEKEKLREECERKSDSSQAEVENLLREISEMKLASRRKEEEWSIKLAEAKSINISREDDLFKEAKELRKVKVELRDALSKWKHAVEEKAQVLEEKEVAITELREYCEALEQEKMENCKTLQSKIRELQEQNSHLNASLSTVNKTLDSKIAEQAQLEESVQDSVATSMSSRKHVDPHSHLTQTTPVPNTAAFLQQENLHSHELEELLDNHIHKLQVHLAASS
eukprot:Nk52_evm78s62 gene=Nk52_evmTU78s62